MVERPITRAGITALSARGAAWMEATGARTIVCDVRSIPDPDAVTLEALARMALTVRRLGGEVQLRHASPRLRDLLVLVGLCAVLPLEAPSALEAEGQAEQREHAISIEEVMEPDDPAS